MKTDTHSLDQAKAQLESVMEMVAELDHDNPDVREQAQQRIADDPLDIQVRSGWHAPTPEVPVPAQEFYILLCTGGPACRIIGELSEHGEPATARIEHQDWGTPWTNYPLNEEQEQAVLRYCREFYFGT